MSNRAERRRADKLAAKSGYAAQLPKPRPIDRYDLKVKPSEVVSDEKLVSCAIMHDDDTISKGFHSHWELRSSLDYEDAAKFRPGDTPGFWTSKERFVRRKEAMHIAFEAGQVRQLQQRDFLSSDVDVW